MKFSHCAAKRSKVPSLPVRGAWIEIFLSEWQALDAAGRSPCGERGLKSAGGCWLWLAAGRSPCGERGLK